MARAGPSDKKLPEKPTGNDTPVDLAAEPPLRVVYVYGMESGPEGRKAKFLKESSSNGVPWEVRVPEHQSSKPSVSLQHMARSPLSVAAIAFALVVLAGLIYASAVFGDDSVKYSLVAASTFWGLFTVWLLLALIGSHWRRAVAADLANLKQKIAEFGPDVVVGSSYGGALVSLCIRRGDWDGPTVLLAPATGTIARLVGLDLSDCLWSPSHTRVFIVHSEEDALVPFSDAEWLHSCMPGSRLIPVCNDDHRLNALIEKDCNTFSLFNLRGLVECATGDSEIPQQFCPTQAVKLEPPTTGCTARCFGNCSGLLVRCVQCFRGRCCSCDTQDIVTLEIHSPTPN